MAENSTLKKILLVDDDHFLLDMYLTKFKNSGLEVDTAPSGSAALAKLREVSNFDILLLDIIMPGMDGIEVLKSIRDEKLVPKATIVILTNQPDRVDEAKKLGVDGYIVKATSIPSEVVSQVLSIYKSKQK